MHKSKVSTDIPGEKGSRVINIINQNCAESTFAYPLVIADGEGCYIKDLDGNIFLDFTSNIGTAPLGYAHPDLLDVLKEYSRNGINKIAGQDFYCIEHAELALRVLKIAPNNFRAFFTNSGAEAVENAIKLAYRKTAKRIGISCYGAFHGRTLGALTFTYSKEVQKKNYPELPVKRIKFCTSDDDPSIDDIEDVIESDIAFIIIEVIQGEGGYNIASKKFVKKIYDISREYGIPLIIDEVQSGMGRTGRWWAFQHYDVKPDIISAAKALQVGATLFDSSFLPERGAISSTWGGGDRIDMAIGSKIIDVIIRDRLLENASRMGNSLLKRLKEISNKKGNMDVRGIGLMIGIEFDTVEKRDQVLIDAFKNGLLLLQAGTKAIRISPPLIISEEEVDEGIDILEKVI